MEKKINITVFFILIFSFSIVLFIKKDSLLSSSERRYLTQAPSIELSDLKDGTFDDNLEDYLLDQFPARDSFRALKAFANYNLFFKLENQGIIINNGSMIDFVDSYNYDSVDDTIIKINKLKNNMFSNNKCYFALIPDKSCLCNLSGMDYDYSKIEGIVKNTLDPTITYIPIGQNLTLDDYYKTDSHWSQEQLIDTRDILLSTMGCKATSSQYTSNTINDYVGVYAGKSALSYIKDEIIYLSNEYIDACEVYNYETIKTTPVYDLNKLHDKKSLDKYDIFLSGATPLLKITTPNNNNKTLVIFRDSYGSSLAPLMLEAYETVYLVDIRYMDSSYIDDYINIENNYDVLFIYSTSIINIPNNFKIK